jgi:hypothetical protein
MRRYDWNAAPARQEAPPGEFWRGMVFGAVIEAALVLAAVWALWGIFR